MKNIKKALKAGILALVFSATFTYQGLLAEDSYVATGNLTYFNYYDAASETYVDLYEGTFEAIVTFDETAPADYGDSYEDCYEDAMPEYSYCFKNAYSERSNAISSILYKIYDVDGNMLAIDTVEHYSTAPENTYSYSSLYNFSDEFTDFYGSYTNASSNWSISNELYSDTEYAYNNANLSWYSFDSIFLTDALQIPSWQELNAADYSEFSISNSYTNYETSDYSSTYLYGEITDVTGAILAKNHHGATISALARSLNSSVGECVSGQERGTTISDAAKGK